MADSTELSIAIIGAGIAGLTAAIGLKRNPSINVQIYERATELREIGATIALGPNGLKTLDKLGIANALEDSVAFRNKSGYPMIYKHYQTNETVSVDRHSDAVLERYHTARFHRPHLQRALLQHVEPSIINLNKSFASVKQDDITGKLLVTFTDESTTLVDLVLGADGINSAVRKYFVPTSQASWTGWVAFRSVFPSSHLSHIADLPDEAVHIWGPDRTLFLSPLAQGLFTVVGSHQSDPKSPNAAFNDSLWSSDGDVSTLREFYKDWSPVVKAIIDATPYTKVYPNTAADTLSTWIFGDGRVTLAGDAAHAHGGAFAAGGSEAIDDAWAFSQAVLHFFSESAYPNDSRASKVARALQLYAATRQSHTKRVQTTVQARNARVVKRLGEQETDGSLRKRMTQREDLKWIHEHDVEAAFKEAKRQFLKL
ncbi:salicylate 1-monooxygenase [Stachybotrys elegans]|uniref:Salicylate 1-monooxygenase n=1 Tax=Stachybotrys elegans TaxID=80388 RepID=A0A8K0SRF8_9HYPO|nr:salicylate 1-monooxygenase [Stachybotrys elegans]